MRRWEAYSPRHHNHVLWFFLRWGFSDLCSVRKFKVAKNIDDFSPLRDWVIRQKLRPFKFSFKEKSWGNPAALEEYFSSASRIGVRRLVFKKCFEPRGWEEVALAPQGRRRVFQGERAHYMGSDGMWMPHRAAERGRGSGSVAGLQAILPLHHLQLGTRRYTQVHEL